ncbi:MAG: hypothetical protein ETSY2_42355 [Candidatus Entotheonella gemina]|uniref:Aldehyde oxidase/xanthine dehydrogenase a/b hammerhead domain-containing protein n=2 Tax=Candidatus Entotheonella TaxID=93171 RepID=W4LL64_9BACT|nr:MAG: hypothetical protein ETSY2_42355 [Candidatus Entotheonella gemina]
MPYTHQSLKRFEDEPLLTGRGAFVDDLVRPDMLVAAVVRSPHAHARITSIRTATARARPSVVEVMTADDIAGDVRPLPALTREGAEYMTLPEHPVLASDVVYYAGQPVALVVAEQHQQAQDAMEAVEVDYEPLPATIDPQLALTPEHPTIHAEMQGNLALRARIGRGDMNDARAQADRILRGRFESPRLSALPLETRGIVADYDPGHDQLTLWMSTQVPYRMRTQLADVFVRPPQGIRVIAPDVGGGFGQKMELWPEYVAVGLLSMKLRRPVKWIEGRMENLQAYHSRGFTGEVEAAVTRDGVILGLRCQMVADLGAFMMSFSAAPPVNSDGH